MKLNIFQALNLIPINIKILKTLLNRNLSDKEICKAVKCRRIKENLMDLIKDKFIKYNLETKTYELTISGSDAFSISELKKRGLSKIYGVVGVGKEAEIYKAKFNKKIVALKFHRVGKNSFKSFKRSRVGLSNTKETYNAINKKKLDWKECSVINRKNEEFFLKSFKALGLRVPGFIDSDRHILVMEFINGETLFQIKASETESLNIIYESCLDFIITLYNHGFVHNDFNEFNVMLEDEGKGVVIIDFPQVVRISTNPEYSKEIFQKDLQNIVDFFKRRFQFISERGVASVFQEIK
ncbi:Serine/threonine-protein kinase RIO2 [Cucumispora dikerogammari]|nr:Serine/threonine-protein kinase RIO2 [Cucumispora dikerogammari]